MGAEGMMGIAARKLGGKEALAPEVREMMLQSLRSRIDIKKVAQWGLVDAIIDPRDTRSLLAQTLKATWQRQTERPWRKRGIVP